MRCRRLGAESRCRDALIYTLGETSGAHRNPAVSVAFATRGAFPWRRVPGYVLAQMGGAPATVILGTASGARPAAGR
ncbi:aquaporin [Streptomyces sp. NBC_01233]|uniref:aquaporin n=1 Tax=Streptomyces sp. NBC_01233 TaxID=2903787 RepID=UPI003FA3C2E0